jgi:hypothetical protein
MKRLNLKNYVPELFEELRKVPLSFNVGIYLMIDEQGFLGLDCTNIFFF